MTQGRESRIRARRTASPDPSLPAVEAQAESFRHARKVRGNILFEDYIELIADLIEDGKEARQIDIAARLGVAQPTVARMLSRLADEGLLTRRPYRGVFLTEKGERLAQASRERHKVVETFLLSIGVSAETARKDAEGIEHHVSAETLEIFRKLAEKKRA